MKNCLSRGPGPIATSSAGLQQRAARGQPVERRLAPRPEQGGVLGKSACLGRLNGRGAIAFSGTGRAGLGQLLPDKLQVAAEGLVLENGLVHDAGLLAGFIGFAEKQLRHRFLEVVGEVAAEVLK